MRMLILITIVLTISLTLETLQVTAREGEKSVTDDLPTHSNKIDFITIPTIEMKTNSIANIKESKESAEQKLPIYPGIPSILLSSSAKEIPKPLFTNSSLPTATAFPTSSSIITLSNFPPTEFSIIANEDTSPLRNQYCLSTLCEFYNGSHINVKPHIACKNSGNFSPACGSQPNLLKMNERRRNLILDLHNLARSRIASGQVEGYKTASHMPQLKWDNDLEYLASLHVKRCKFEHDLCHNTPRFPYSGQNIGYFWKDGGNITSHSKRIKNFIVNWYKEHKDANQSYIESFHLHPDNKVIGHFTAMIGDRVHHIGCAVIRFYESNLTQILMTCNYDYNNFLGEPIYHTGSIASKCPYKISDKYPALCDWKYPTYEYDVE